MGKFSEYKDQISDTKDFQQRSTIVRLINERWGQLYHLDKEWSDKAVNFLFVTNSGGAIAVLSFIGALRNETPLGAKIALIMFLLAIILVGVLVARTYHLMSGLFSNWQKDTRDFYADKISYEDLTARDDRRSGTSKIDVLIGYICFLLFIAGVVVGCSSLYPQILTFLLGLFRQNIS